MWLNIAGVFLEIAGFSLVAYELFRTQRREFGDPKPLKLIKALRARVKRFFRKLFRRPRKVVEMSATLTGTASLTAKGLVRSGRGKTLEDHVAALEANFARLDQEVDEHRRELDKEIAGVQGELRKTRDELERQREEREQEQREFLRASVSLQWWGIGLFILGVLSSGAANVISCS